ncbi:MAG: glycosyltransferase family 4 protein [Gemmatimonadales bacterium]
MDAKASEVRGVRIAYIVTRADPIGGVQIHIKDLAAAVQARGDDATVLAGGEGPFIDALRAQGTAAIVLQHLSVPIRPMRDLLALREIRKVVIRLQPELLAVHSAKATVLGRLVGRSLGIPVVVTAHGWTFTPGFPPLQAAVYRQLERFVGPLANKIIAVSEFDRRLALEARIVAEDRIVTVHNGIPDIPVQRRAAPARTPPRLIMVARLGAQKDHASLLRAVAGLMNYSWELDLVGEGPLMDEMKSLADALGVGGRVRFLGQRLDVDQLIAEAQVGLLVTNWEGFPLSILESMRAGLPVVASSVGGTGEAVRDGETGYLVPRGDVELLRDRIERLLADPALRVRMGTSGRSHYEEHFTLDRAVNKTIAVYRDVVAGGKASRLATDFHGEESA